MHRILSSLKNPVARCFSSQSSQASVFPLIITRKPAPEPPERYEPGGYHPVKVGDVYNQRYRVVRQLGWGLYSTVWQIEDIQVQRQAALKVLTGKMTHDTTGWDEPGILKTLRDQNPEADGHQHLCHLLDDFIVEGPHGAHICLVTELMGPTLLDIFRGVPGAMPLPLVKRISRHILLALQYMHECNMAHTDIKCDNIFMSDAPPTPTYPEGLVAEEVDLISANYKLGDMGSTNRISNRYAPLIQPNALRCPEVILGAEWGTKADIWNFGCLMYELARGAVLFDPQWNTEKSGLTPYETHLAQMAGLLGGFPRTLSKSSPHAERYFDAQGRLLKGVGEYAITLEALLGRAGHPPKDMPLTIDFLSRALTIDPERRWSANQLLAHPWLTEVV